ncbi:glycosyltransferase family 39 protein [Candidatus Falkowbacteria bacterium]|nr:glycosyltransferase family 39 protein [Candidatus Falkowbacteria bacterium]
MNKKIIFLVLILAMAAILRFWNLAQPDLLTDDALYSVRALGWFDYLGGGQTTPVQWFGHIPWWANLSFHDAPPTVFLIQKIFFVLFGPNSFAARLPFALAGVLTVYLIYLIISELRSKQTAILGALFISILSWHIWISHFGFLEDIESTFIVLTFWLLIKFDKTNENRFLFYSAVAAGLAIMSKLTAVFFLPILAIYFLVYRIKLLKNKNFWLTVLIFVAVISPYIIYNTFVFTTRGHFDYGLSLMLGMHPQDYSSISAPSIRPDLFVSLKGILVESSNYASWPLLFLSMLALVQILYQQTADKFKTKTFELLAALGLILSLIVLALGGLSAPHRLSIIIPWAVIVCILAGDNFYHLLVSSRFKQAKLLAIVLLAVIFTWELLYSVNTHLLPHPWTKAPILYSKIEPSVQGGLAYNEMEKFLNKEVFPAQLEFIRPASIDSWTERSTQNFTNLKFCVLFDEAVNWFAYQWHMSKYQAYYGMPLISVSNLVVAAKDQDPIQILRDIGVETFYLILPVDARALDPVKANTNLHRITVALAQDLEKQNIKPVEIKNHFGEVMFKVYKFH